jgi:hypothetical protein
LWDFYLKAQTIMTKTRNRRTAIFRRKNKYFLFLVDYWTAIYSLTMISHGFFDLSFKISF